MEGQGAILYVNDGTGVFADESRQRGLQMPTRRFTGFGIGWFGVNSDEWLDLLFVNGGIGYSLSRRPTLEEPKQLLLNNGRKFWDASRLAGATMSTQDV